MRALRRVAVAAVIAIGGAVPASASAARCANADVVPAAHNLAAVRHATLCLINSERTTRGLVRLDLHDGLGKAANAYAQAMAARGFFSHVSPSGSTPSSRVRAATAYLAHASSWAIGENLAYAGGDLATPRQMIAAWMRSPGHRRNILTPSYRQLGVGIALGTPDPNGTPPGATYATEFGVRRAS